MNRTIFFRRTTLAVIAAFSAGALVACDHDSGDDIDISNDYTFSTDGPEAYTVIDRHGAVEAGTVGIAAAAGLGQAPIRNLYNASNPREDAAGRWVGEITNSLTALHAALDDDLRSLGLVPATLQVSLNQAGPVIVPDVIHYNPNEPTSYPNGRKLTDQVVDLTVAAALLDLNQNGQNIRTFADIPLNPPANDVEFKSGFPYLADPHHP